jgi:cell division protein FtsB
MIDKCSCGATCAQVEALQAEVERLKAENWHLKHQLYLLVKEQSE